MSSTIVSTDQPVAKTGIRQLLGSDLGQLPVVAALIVMAAYFQFTTDGLFLSSRNLSYLVLQTIVIGMVSLAAVLVLLIGEIDLSLAAVSSLCGAVMVVASKLNGMNAFQSILFALIAGAVIGAINGVLIAILRVPSFIVTLAALIGYSGLVLHILLPNTTIRLADPFLKQIASTYMPDVLGFGIPILAVAAYAGVNLYQRSARQRQGLAFAPLWQTLTSIGLVAVVVAVAVASFYNYLGIPYVAVILIGFITVFWVLLKFTSFGRFVYAVGGNAEAARRAGINVVAIRIAIFSLASTLAAVAGILESSRTISASTQVNSNLLLQAIAAAVIGGVSLFGGRGSVWAVVMGSLLIGGLLNGLALKGQNADIQQMVEAIVLILAVIADAVLRRRNAVTGR